MHFTITAVMSQRSINPDDYQDVPVPVAIMEKPFEAGFSIDWHAHRRDQLIFATEGTMRVHTHTHSWIVPPGRAVYMPGRVEHAVSMRDAVEMLTLYIEPGVREDLPKACAALTATPLLSELIRALREEPAAYPIDGRGGWLARLILDEICRCNHLALSVPMPRDLRLRHLCEAILEAPDDQRSFDELAEDSGASPRTLARLCRNELGVSFSVWRQQVRFHHALEALSRGAPVGLVARDCGYRSASAFSAAFRKTMGQPPSRALADTDSDAHAMDTP